MDKKKVKIKELPPKIKEIKEIKNEEDSELEEDVQSVEDDAVVESGSRSAIVLSSGQVMERNAEVNAGGERREEEISGNRLYDTARQGGTTTEERNYSTGGENEYGNEATPRRREINSLGSERGRVIGMGRQEDSGLDRGQMVRDLARTGEDNKTRKYQSPEAGGGGMRVKRRKEMY